jgi:hypothetical protein
MPDTGTSRKRQIRIGPRPFSGDFVASASAAAARVEAGRYPPQRFTHYKGILDKGILGSSGGGCSTQIRKSLHFDSLRRAAWRTKTVCCGAFTAHSPANCAIRNFRMQSYPYKESTIQIACSLCNTPRKRAKAGAFRAVPLLRVQESSVIVITRRRGASRGRPVRWFA